MREDSIRGHRLGDRKTRRWSDKLGDGEIDTKLNTANDYKTEGKGLGL